MLKTFVGLLSVFVISFGLMITPAMAEEATTDTEAPAVDAAPPEGEEAQQPEEATEEEAKPEEAAE
jgi:hypothetical protein